MAFDSSAGFDETAFRAEVRDFLGEALTPDLRAAGRATIGVYSDIAACRVWHRRLHAHGWIAPAWPAAWGGAGWCARRRHIFDEACADNDAPLLFAASIRSLGPLLIEQGTEMQRDIYLPRILSGEHFWCQGFSEPGAGSDLAALSTRADRVGEEYVINGQKVWTTGAHLADHMFALVRTARGARKQDGITFLLVDLTRPGVRIEPIIDIAGMHELNQVFFDDVRVPVEDRVGAENDGWAVARRLMHLARSNNTPAALVRRAVRRAGAAIADAGLENDRAARGKLGALLIDLEAFSQLELAALPSGRPGAGDATTPSMLKVIGAELHQRAATLWMEYAAPHGAARFCPVMDEAATATARYLSLRAATIYSGASEAQRNIMARAFGL